VSLPLYEHPAWRQIQQQRMRPGGFEITKRALDFCDLPPGARLLDVGCGMGAALRDLRACQRWNCCGVDLSAALLQAARQNCPDAFFLQARGERLPFASESLDAVLAECTLSIMETGHVLQEWARVLKHDGYLIVNDVYARNESGIEALRKLPAGTCIGAAMPQGQILERLERCGFRLAWWQDCSEKLKEFSICTLTEAAKVDPFDLQIAAARARLGYYFLAAQKDGRECPAQPDY